MEKMREEFEAWFWHEFHNGSDVELYQSSVFATTVNGDYRGIACHTYWTVWKASRSALCVNLPDSERSIDCGDVLYRSDVEDALIAAGIRYV